MPRRTTTSFIMLLAVSLGGCVTTPYTAMTADIGQPVYYQNAHGDVFEARYGSLSDGSLSFVKVTMPGGKQYTLPQVVSGSGARYTDDRQLVWWTHQDTVRVDARGADGKWETKYPELRHVKKTKQADRPGLIRGWWNSLWN